MSAYLAYRSGPADPSPFSDVSEDYVRQLLELFPPIPKPYTPLTEPLTGRESNFLRLLRQGASNKQIAVALDLSEGTVRIYLSRLYEKLGVSSRTQALIAAQDLQLLD